jgi:uncharacterized protein
MLECGDSLLLKAGQQVFGPYDITPGAGHFWKAVGQCKLELPRCRECGCYSHPRQESCQVCYSPELAWQGVSGEGEVYTYSVVYRSTDPARETPHALGFVRLKEDVHLFAELRPWQRVRIGVPVRAAFVGGTGGTMLVFDAGG